MTCAIIKVQIRPQNGAQTRHDITSEPSGWKPQLVFLRQNGQTGFTQIYVHLAPYSVTDCLLGSELIVIVNAGQCIPVTFWQFGPNFWRFDTQARACSSNVIDQLGS